MVYGDSRCSGPGNPEQGPEHEGAVAGRSQGGRVEGRPAEGPGSPLGLGADSLVLHAYTPPGAQETLLGAPRPPSPLLERAGAGTLGTLGGQTLAQGTGGKQAAPPTQTGSGTSLLGGGSEGRKGSRTGPAWLWVRHLHTVPLCLSRQGGEARGLASSWPVSARPGTTTGLAGVTRPCPPQGPRPVPPTQAKVVFFL